MAIRFGADMDGFVHLYAIHPEAEPEFIQTFKVKAETVNKVEALTKAPNGDQALLAVYSKTESNAHLTDYQWPGWREGREKGITLIEERPLQSYALYRFTIRP